MTLDALKAERFRRRLSLWFDSNGRSFPWRSSRDVYSLLVAEVLLQKTNAGKVAPAYEQVLRAYPSAQALADADRDDLRRIIAPLGIISKADTLRSMATGLSAWRGQKPTVEKLLKLSGVGDYIARAVVIHAAGKRLPLIDPNFLRILDRVFDVRSKRPRPRTDMQLWEVAKLLTPRRKVSRHVYAMLDFGALVCKARRPLCRDCVMMGNVCSGVLRR